MTYTEYADKQGRIYTDKDVELFNAKEMNLLGLHKVNEEWMPEDERG